METGEPEVPSGHSHMAPITDPVKLEMSTRCVSTQVGVWVNGESWAYEFLSAENQTKVIGMVMQHPETDCLFVFTETVLG